MSKPSTGKRLKAANDNGPLKQKPIVTTDLPDQLGIIEGEAALLAEVYSDIMALGAANDNEPPEEQE